jgi:hypothetical protein
MPSTGSVGKLGVGQAVRIERIPNDASLFYVPHAKPSTLRAYKMREYNPTTVIFRIVRRES